MKCPSRYLGGGFSPGSGRSWTKGGVKPAAVTWSWEGQGCVPLGESLLWFLLRICSERSLEALQREADGEVGQLPASLALDPHCGCLCLVGVTWILMQTYSLGGYCCPGFPALSARDLEPHVQVGEEKVKGIWVFRHQLSEAVSYLSLHPPLPTAPFSPTWTRRDKTNWMI